MKYAIKEMALLQEARDVQIVNKGKVRYKAKLQMLDEYSYNGKLYRKQPMMEGINKKADMLQRGGWVGELDHPIDPSMMRMLNVLYKEASHIFKEVYTEGNVVWGVLENTSNRVGMDLYGLIAIDKIPVGYSLRALGDVKETNQGQEVFRDIDVITWDCVSNPGYSSCILQEILNNKHLESYMLQSDVANLEEYVYGNTQRRQQMLMESCLKPTLGHVVSKLENIYLFDTPDLEIKTIRKMLKFETKKKIFNLSQGV